MYNSEGYYDPTAFYGMQSTVKAEAKQNKQVHDLIRRLKNIAESEGYEVTCRITLKDKRSGKEFK